MSTLLERMILRTRAPLSSLEPLAEPRYTPAAQAGPLPWEPQSPDPMSAGIAEAAAEPGSAADPGQGIGPGARWQPRARPHAGDLVVPASGELGGDDIDASHAAPPPTRARSAPKSSAPPPVAARRGPGGAQAEPLLGHAAPATAPPVAARRGPGGAQAEPLLGHAAPATRAEHGSGERVVRELGPMPSPPGGQPVAVSVRLLPASPHTPALTGRPGPQAPQTPVAAEVAPPEVTISIGHIEVRSASATVQRPKPVFRPQVSLAEFLARRQGGRR